MHRNPCELNATLDPSEHRAHLTRRVPSWATTLRGMVVSHFLAAICACVYAWCPFTSSWRDGTNPETGTNYSHLEPLETCSNSYVSQTCIVICRRVHTWAIMHWSVPYNLIGRFATVRPIFHANWRAYSLGRSRTPTSVQANRDNLSAPLLSIPASVIQRLRVEDQRNT